MLQNKHPMKNIMTVYEAQGTTYDNVLMIVKYSEDVLNTVSQGNSDLVVLMATHKCALSILGEDPMVVLKANMSIPNYVVILCSQADVTKETVIFTMQLVGWYREFKLIY